MVGEFFLVYFFVFVVFKLVVDIVCGYCGDLCLIEVYDMFFFENVVIVDIRGFEVIVQFLGGVNKCVFVCGIEKSGVFFNVVVGKVVVFKIVFFRGVSRGKKVILFD